MAILDDLNDAIVRHYARLTEGLPPLPPPDPLWGKKWAHYLWTRTLWEPTVAPPLPPSDAVQLALPDLLPEE